MAEAIPNRGQRGAAPLECDTLAPPRATCHMSGADLSSLQLREACCFHPLCPRSLPARLGGFPRGEHGPTPGIDPRPALGGRLHLHWSLLLGKMGESSLRLCWRVPAAPRCHPVPRCTVGQVRNRQVMEGFGGSAPVLVAPPQPGLPGVRGSAGSWCVCACTCLWSVCWDTPAPYTHMLMRTWAHSHVSPNA